MPALARKNSVSVNTAGNFLTFPTDIVPEDDKDLEKWMKGWSDSLYHYGALCLDERDNLGYQYAQGRIPDSEFDHVLKLFANPNFPNRVLPAKRRDINSTARVLNDMMGQLDGDKLAFSVAVTNEDAITEKLEKLVKKQAEDLTRYVRQQAGVTETLGRPLKEGDDVMQVSLEDIENRNLTTFQQENEIYVSKGLKYLINKKSSYLQHKFVHQGFYNYSITGKMAFDTSVLQGDPYAEPIDSRLLVYELESQSPFIHKGRFNGYYFSLTPQEALDRCPNMTKDDVAYVEEVTKNFTAGALRFPSSFMYKNTTLKNLYFNGMKQYWKGLKKCLVKTSPRKLDEDNPHIHFVSEEEYDKWKKKEKQLKEDGKESTTDVKFEYWYFNVWFECTRIGEKVYYQCREIPNQLMDDEEPSEMDSPLIGIHDDLPSIQKLLEPLDNMKIQCFYHLEKFLSQPMGKVMIVDEAIDEDGQDNLYNMAVFKVYKVNTAKEGEMREQGGSPPMMPKEVDLGMSDAFNQIIRLIAFIDQQMLSITGLNEPFFGNIKSDQGLGVTQMAQQSAQRALQPYYSNYYTVIEMVLQRMCDLMRPAWSGKSVTKYWMGDKMAEFFNLDPDTDWHLDKYGVFVQNNIASNQQKQQMTQMASQLLPIAKDPELALSIIKMFRADSAAEAEEIFAKGIDAMRKMQAQDMQMQQQQMQSANQAVQMQEQTKMATEKLRSDTILQKTELEQAGESSRKQLEVTHKEDAMTVEYRNDLAQKIADTIIETNKVQPQATTE